MTVQMQMFYLFQVVKKQLIEPRNTKKNIAVSTVLQRKDAKPIACRFCGKTLSDSSKIKRHEKPKRCTEAKDNV